MGADPMKGPVTASTGWGGLLAGFWMLGIAFAAGPAVDPRVLALVTREPREVSDLLMDLARTGDVDLIVGEGVRGLTTFPGAPGTVLEAVVDAARGAGFTVRVVDRLVAVRTKGISPTRIVRDDPLRVRPVPVTLVHEQWDCPRNILESLVRQSGVGLRFDRDSHGSTRVRVRGVPAGTVINLFCEAMGYDWGRAGPLVVVAPRHRLAHFEIEMRLDLQLGLDLAPTDGPRFP